MIWSKACSRCKRGDVYLDEDNAKHCMQCGYVQYGRDDRLSIFRLERFLGAEDAERDPVAATA